MARQYLIVRSCENRNHLAKGKIRVGGQAATSPTMECLFQLPKAQSCHEVMWQSNVCALAAMPLKLHKRACFKTSKHVRVAMPSKPPCAKARYACLVMHAAKASTWQGEEDSFQIRHLPYTSACAIMRSKHQGIHLARGTLTWSRGQTFHMITVAHAPKSSNIT